MPKDTIHKCMYPVFVIFRELYGTFFPRQAAAAAAAAASGDTHRAPPAGGPCGWLAAGGGGPHTAGRQAGSVRACMWRGGGGTAAASAVAGAPPLLPCCLPVGAHLCPCPLDQPAAFALGRCTCAVLHAWVCAQLARRPALLQVCGCGCTPAGAPHIIYRIIIGGWVRRLPVRVWLRVQACASVHTSARGCGAVSGRPSEPRARRPARAVRWRRLGHMAAGGAPWLCKALWVPTQCSAAATCRAVHLAVCALGGLACVRVRVRACRAGRAARRGRPKTDRHQGFARGPPPYY
jgi:hypothetical protein